MAGAPWEATARKTLDHARQLGYSSAGTLTPKAL